jgi:hypothetical protein
LFSPNPLKLRFEAAKVFFSFQLKNWGIFLFNLFQQLAVFTNEVGDGQMSTGDRKMGG